MRLTGQALIAFAPDGTLRALKPGELFVAYGIGFGDTSPAVPAGSVAGASPLPQLAAPLTVTIGGVTLPAASIVYAGLAPGFVGLYQFDFIVPNVPAGSQPVTMRIGSSSVPQSMTLAVTH
jgi:uncharacterized protein (TIGR03437 family)